MLTNDIEKTLNRKLFQDDNVVQLDSTDDSYVQYTNIMALRKDNSVQQISQLLDKFKVEPKPDLFVDTLKIEQQLKQQLKWKKQIALQISSVSNKTNNQLQNFSLVQISNSNAELQTESILKDIKNRIQQNINKYTKNIQTEQPEVQKSRKKIEQRKFDSPIKSDNPLKNNALKFINFQNQQIKKKKTIKTKSPKPKREKQIKVIIEDNYAEPTLKHKLIKCTSYSKLTNERAEQLYMQQKNRVELQLLKQKRLLSPLKNSYQSPVKCKPNTKFSSPRGKKRQFSPRYN